MKIRMLGIALSVAALAAISFACGEETETTGTGGATGDTVQVADIPDPCELLTKADIESIMGDSVSEPMRVNAANLRACDYTATIDGRQAGITIIKPCSMADYANMSTGDPIEGIGMHAAWDKSTLTVHTMNNECLIASGGGPAKGQERTDENALATARAVAMTVLERMGGSGMEGGTDTEMGGAQTGMSTSTGMGTSTDMRPDTGMDGNGGMGGM